MLGTKNHTMLYAAVQGRKLAYARENLPHQLQRMGGCSDIRTQPPPSWGSQRTYGKFFLLDSCTSPEICCPEFESLLVVEWAAEIAC